MGSQEPVVGLDPQAFLGFADSLQFFVELVTGYKAQWVDAGFHDDVAQQMAVQLHAQLIAKAFAGVN